MSPRHDDPKPWIPYEGEHYHKTRLLLLGESAYSWRENNDLQDPSIDLPTELNWSQSRSMISRFLHAACRA